MKRTPFASKPKKEKPDRPARISHKRGQSSIWRSDAYLALVRSLPCTGCGIYGHSQAAHSNQLRMGKSRGMKASDASAMPLCGPRNFNPGCHTSHDQGGKLTKSEWKAFEDQHICKTIYDLIDDGRLVAVNKLPALDCGLDEMAAYLVTMIESGAIQIA